MPDIKAFFDSRKCSSLESSNGAGFDAVMSCSCAQAGGHARVQEQAPAHQAHVPVSILGSSLGCLGTDCLIQPRV